MEIPQQACWRREDVTVVLSNEALEGHEGIFLATHSPIRDFTVAGSHAGEIEGQDEQSVLDALAKPERRHAFCVVQGEPGSGKSHLIRWLYVNWPAGKDVKLLLQRADGSLEGALGQLQERLPPEFKELFEKLGRRHRATEQGRANLFLSNLANALDPDHFDPPLEDAAWCRETRVTDLVGHLAAKRNWRGPSRILRILEGRGVEDGEERNSASASFNLYDIEELANCFRGVRGSGLLPQTELLAQLLVREADLITEFRAKGWAPEELERESLATMRKSIHLMNALNRRRNDAVQNLLGVSAEGLKQLFRQIRRELAARGHRLVLLLEDITSWEGIDDSLIDVLVTNAETRSADGETDMCPLISVVGVTPAYYDKLHGNYRGRITHEFCLGEAKVAGDLQDVATLRTSSARLSFAARYLAAVRSGEDSLQAWRNQRRENPQLQPPNRCDHCPMRDGCHETFGSVDGIGMFPLSTHAFERLFDALNERDGGMTWKTPRGILQAILGTTLAQPAAIVDGRFPTPLIGSTGIVSDSRRLSPRLTRIVEQRAPAEERDRASRLLAYWGDKERADTTRSAGGNLCFVGIPYATFIAFNLPWLGEEEADAVGVAHVRPTAPDSPLVNNKEEDSDPESTQSVRVTSLKRGGLGATARPKIEVPAPPSKRRAVSRSDLDKFRDQIRNWRDTDHLENPTHWNKVLFDLVRNVDARRIDLDPQTFARLVTEANVKIEGTGQVNRNHLVVERAPWLLDGLEAYIALRLDTQMTAEYAEFHRRNLASMLRRLETLAGSYATKRLSLIARSHRWNPTAALVQLLLARAWLRGATSPDAPPFEQLKALLSDEGSALSDPESRSAPWQSLLDKTKDWHVRFREELRAMLALPQGESRAYGLVDVSVAAAAIHRLRDTLKFDPVPKTEVDTGVSEYNKARDVVTEMGGSIARVVRVERDQIAERGRSLEGLLRGRSVTAHFERLDTTIESVSRHLPNAAPDQVSKWKASFTRARERFQTGAAGRIEDFLVGQDQDETASVRPLEGSLLATLLRAPARDIEEARLLALLGEQVVATVHGHVADCIRAEQGSASLDDVHKVGRHLMAVITEISSECSNETAA